jgi:hypothetical protein
MTASFLLMLLTLGDTGQINAAFINTQSLITCQAKSKMLEAMMNTSNIKIIKNSCFETSLLFSKYSHEKRMQEVPNSYLISITDKDIQISPSKNKMACIVDKEKLTLKSQQEEVYCTTSTQKLTVNNNH